jgi:hypothetical protein
MKSLLPVWNTAFGIAAAVPVVVGRSSMSRHALSVLEFGSIPLTGLLLESSRSPRVCGGTKLLILLDWFLLTSSRLLNG